MVDQVLPGDAAGGRVRARIGAPALALVLALGLLAGGARAEGGLDRIRAAGVLKVAVYKDFFPYSERGQGIDVDLGQALAAKMGLRADLMPFDAGETMGDDFRNMVWKGHYLGYGPADVLMHVPVDRVLSTRNEQVRIFGAYHRETIRLALDTARAGPWVGMELFAHERVAVDGGTISAQALLGADGGRYRQQVVLGRGIHEAIEAVTGGRAVALMATRSEIEAGLQAADPAHAYEVVEPGLPTLPPRGWLVGMAVRSDAAELADALQKALDQLREDGTLARIFSQHGVKLASP